MNKEMVEIFDKTNFCNEDACLDVMNTAETIEGQVYQSIYGLYLATVYTYLKNECSAVHYDSILGYMLRRLIREKLFFLQRNWSIEEEKKARKIVDNIKKKPELLKKYYNPKNKMYIGSFEIIGYKIKKKDILELYRLISGIYLDKLTTIEMFGRYK